MPDTPPPDDPFAARRAADGVYSSCFEKFSTAKDSLSQLDFMADFHHETTAWSVTSDCFTTRFLRPFCSDELTVTLFGEVLSEINGTGFGAMGGSSLKRDQVIQSSNNTHSC